MVLVITQEQAGNVREFFVNSYNFIVESISNIFTISPETVKDILLFLFLIEIIVTLISMFLRIAKGE